MCSLVVSIHVAPIITPLDFLPVSKRNPVEVARVVIKSIISCGPELHAPLTTDGAIERERVEILTYNHEGGGNGESVQL